MSGSRVSLPIKLSDLVLREFEGVRLAVVPDQLLEADDDYPRVSKVWRFLSRIPPDREKGCLVMPPVRECAARLNMHPANFRRNLQYLHNTGWITILNINQENERKARYMIMFKTISLNMKMLVELEAELDMTVIKTQAESNPGQSLIIYNSAPEAEASKAEQDNIFKASSSDPGRLHNAGPIAPPSVGPYQFPPFIQEIKDTCFAATDVGGMSIAKCSDLQIKAFCRYAPDWEIAVAMQEANSFIPEEGKPIKSLNKLLQRRFELTDTDGWHLRPTRNFQLENGEYIMAALKERCEKYQRPVDFFPDEKSFFSLDDIEEVCGKLAINDYVERGKIPLHAVLKRYSWAFEDDPVRGRTYCRLKNGYSLVRQSRGHWWLTSNHLPITKPAAEAVEQQG